MGCVRCLRYDADHRRSLPIRLGASGASVGIDKYEMSTFSMTDAGGQLPGDSDSESVKPFWLSTALSVQRIALALANPTLPGGRGFATYAQQVEDCL